MVLGRFFLGIARTRLRAELVPRRVGRSQHKIRRVPKNAQALFYDFLGMFLACEQAGKNCAEHYWKGGPGGGGLGASNHRVFKGVFRQPSGWPVEFLTVR